MTQVGEGGKRGKDKGQELSEQERRSRKFIEFLEKLSKERWHDEEDDDCEPLQASRDWSKITAVGFTKVLKDAARDFFTPKYSAVGLPFSKGSKSPKTHGKKIHQHINDFLKKRRGEKTELGLTPKEEKELEKFVKDVEENFKFRILASELWIRGYANRSELSKPYCWKGKIDTIGVMNDGTIIVVDWRTYGTVPPDDFWASDIPLQKLHQTMIYREIITAQWEDSYKDVGVVPKVNILIVPISSTNTGVSDPRLCYNFRKLREAGFLDEIDKFKWTAQRPSKDEEKPGCSCYGRKKCAHAQGVGQCDCKAAGKKCGQYCNCDERICTNREKAGCSCHGGKKCAHGRGSGQCDCKANYKKCQDYCGCNKEICTNKPKELVNKTPPPTVTSKEDYLRKNKKLDGDREKGLSIPTDVIKEPAYVEKTKEMGNPIAARQEDPIGQMPTSQQPTGWKSSDWYRTTEEDGGRNSAVDRVTQMPDLRHCTGRTLIHRHYPPEEALQLHSSYIQPGISAAQMVYRESAELKVHEFMKKAGCSCHGRKKCAHAQGAGQCDCKAAGKKCGYYCDCDEQICTNRELMNITWYNEEDYSRKYTASDDDCGYRRYMAGCSCHGKKKCAHARGAGQCDCKAAGKKCGYNCNCDERICTNRAW